MLMDLFFQAVAPVVRAELGESVTVADWNDCSRERSKESGWPSLSISALFRSFAVVNQFA